MDSKTEGKAKEAEALKDAVAALDTPAETPVVEGQAATALPPEEIDRLTTDIVAALKTVYDPEIPADIYELGLIYKVDVDDDRNVDVEMTLTSPGCPVAGEMPGWVEAAVESVGGVKQVAVQMTFDPPWGMEMMSDEARLEMGFM